MDEPFESERAIHSQENTTTSNNSSNEGDDANTCDEENTRRIIGELQSAIQPIHPPRPGVSFSLHDDASISLKSLQGCHFSIDGTARSTADASTRGEDKGNATELNEAPSFDSCQGNTNGLNQQISNHSQNSTRTVLDAEQNEENAEAVVHQSQGSEGGTGEAIERISALRRTMARAHHRLTLDEDEQNGENVPLAQCQELILLRRSLDLVMERNDGNGEVAQRQSETEDIVEEQVATRATGIWRPTVLQRALSFVGRLQMNGATLAEDEQINENDVELVQRQELAMLRRNAETETMSGFINVCVRSSRLLQATLVEDMEEGELTEVFEAEPVSFVERKWKMFASAAGALVLVLLAISVTVFYVSQNGNDEEGRATPTSSPTLDPRPTLEIVQERGHVLCGMSDAMIDSGGGFHIELCRSVAAVVLGNPDSFVGVPVTGATRWRNLLDRKVDLLIRGDTHTVEREIREKSTGSGFTFSTPYTYDGMVFTGNQTLVRCAEENKLYGECVSLNICVARSTTHHKFVEASFPPDYFTFVSSIEGRVDMLINGTCNVIAADKSQIRWSELVHNAIRDGKYIRGEKAMTKEPLAMVTRNTDSEFSDIVNWVLQALHFGQEQGLRKDLSLCPNHTDLTSHDASSLVFMNAVYCVGNYMEIFDEDPNEWKMNQINRGTGMLYSIPFGNVDNDADAEPAARSGMLEKIKSERFFTCGVVIPDDFEGDITRSGNLVGMSVDYCRTLSAAMFNRDSERAHFLNFTDTNNSSAVALANGTLDVLVGGRNQQEFDFETSPSLGGLYFSTPYFYGNESTSNSVSFYSMATREDDVLFASFVNCVVMATIYAQENDIQKHKSREMPLISIFGSEIGWALRNAISYSGSYDEMYAKHFGSAALEAGRGRNTLNEGRPLMLPFLNFSKL